MKWTNASEPPGDNSQVLAVAWRHENGQGWGAGWWYYAVLQYSCGQWFGPDGPMGESSRVDRWTPLPAFDKAATEVT